MSRPRSAHVGGTAGCAVPAGPGDRRLLGRRCQRRRTTRRILVGGESERRHLSRVCRWRPSSVCRLGRLPVLSTAGVPRSWRSRHWVVAALVLQWWLLPQIRVGGGGLWAQLSTALGPGRGRRWHHRGDVHRWWPSAGCLGRLPSSRHRAASGGVSAGRARRGGESGRARPVGASAAGGENHAEPGLVVAMRA